MSLRRLNDDVRAKIRSGTMIRNVCGCVRELLYNSLDAGATHVIVKLDISKYFVQVIDNGCGINHEDMNAVGRQSFTSKLYKSEDLNSISSMGFKGEALFSICELTGTVEVCSRHQLSSETWSKLFRHGRDLGVMHSAHCKSVGTTVTLRDMFYRMPVRQKCIKESLEVEHIRQMIQQTALVNPQVSFVVENGTTGMVIVKSKKVQSVLERISHFYSHDIAKSLRILEHRAGDYHVSGYLSSELSSNKSLQLVYINRRLVFQNQIHTLLDNLLIRKMYSKARAERVYPQYLITMQCPPSDCDFYYQPSKIIVEFVDWPMVLKAVAGAVKNVISSSIMYSDNFVEIVSSNKDDTDSNDGLASHVVTSVHFSRGMQSKRVQKTAAATATLINDTPTGGRRDNSEIAHKFIGIKTVSRSPLHTSSIAQRLTQFSSDRKLAPEHTCSYKLTPPKSLISDMLISPFMPLDHSTPLQTSYSGDTNTAHVASDTNSMMKSQLSLQCQSTGITTHHPPHPKLLSAAPHLSHGTTPFVSGKRVSLSLPRHVANSDSKKLPCSNSVEKLLSKWNNPVFKTGQERIMTTSPSWCCAIPTRLQHHYKFTKQMFDNIRVINQVDNKFIACLMDTKSNGSHDLLVLVDQHSAHERIRVEQLTAELYSEGVYGNNLSGCQIQTSVIDPAVKIHCDQNLLSLLVTFDAQLKTVGINLSALNGLVTVNKLPSVLVHNKVPVVSTASIEEMITEHIEHLSNTGGTSHTMPHKLTDFLATQACHGAIKFNDLLTWNECQKLMELLSQCKLPFQCAHGRPSLIPLLDISLLNKTIP